MNKLTITERFSDQVTIIDLEGDLVFGETIVLREEIRRLLGENKKKIILDFEKVGFVDSSGVGELISSLTAVSRENGDLKLENLSPRVYRLLEISKLLAVFNVSSRKERVELT